MLQHLLFYNPPSHPESTVLDLVRAIGSHGRDGRTLRSLDRLQAADLPETILAALAVRVLSSTLYIGIGPGPARQLLLQDIPSYDPSFRAFLKATPGAEITRRVTKYAGANHARSITIPVAALPQAPGDVSAPENPDTGVKASALARYLSQVVGAKGETLLDLAFAVAPNELDGRKLAARRRRGLVPDTPVAEELLWRARLRVSGNKLLLVMGAAEIERVLGCHPEEIKLGVPGTVLVPVISGVPITSAAPKRNSSSRLEIPLASLEEWRLGGER